MHAHGEVVGDCGRSPAADAQVVEGAVVVERADDVDACVERDRHADGVHLPYMEGRFMEGSWKVEQKKTKN